MSQDPASEPVTAHLHWYFDQHPVHADALGAAGYAHRLGDFSAAAFDSRNRQSAQWLARFEAQPTRRNPRATMGGAKMSIGSSFIVYHTRRARKGKYQHQKQLWLC